MAYDKILSCHARLDRLIQYVCNPQKTTMPGTGLILAEALNCDLETAYQDMKKTKRRWGKQDGILAYHIIHSFAPGEVTPETLQRPDGKSIVLDAQVDVQNVERVDCYQYVPMTITEQQKDALLHAYVGDRAAEGKNYERDGLFQFWALSNSSDPDDMEDIYKYSVTHARAGEHVIPDEDIFLLEYVPGFRLKCVSRAYSGPPGDHSHILSPRRQERRRCLYYKNRAYQDNRRAKRSDDFHRPHDDYL